VLGTPERARGGALDLRSEYLPHRSARTADLRSPVLSRLPRSPAL
jgi:hypothetical protein